MPQRCWCVWDKDPQNVLHANVKFSLPTAQSCKRRRWTGLAKPWIFLTQVRWPEDKLSPLTSVNLLALALPPVAVGTSLKEVSLASWQNNNRSGIKLFTGHCGQTLSWFWKHNDTQPRWTCQDLGLMHGCTMFWASCRLPPVHSFHLCASKSLKRKVKVRSLFPQE